MRENEWSGTSPVALLVLLNHFNSFSTGHILNHFFTYCLVMVNLCLSLLLDLYCVVYFNISSEHSQPNKNEMNRALGHLCAHIG